MITKSEKGYRKFEMFKEMFALITENLKDDINISL